MKIWGITSDADVPGEDPTMLNQRGTPGPDYIGLDGVKKTREQQQNQNKSKNNAKPSSSSSSFSSSSTSSALLPPPFLLICVKED